jgi:hypothetical protein
MTATEVPPLHHAPFSLHGDGESEAIAGGLIAMHA